MSLEARAQWPSRLATGPSALRGSVVFRQANATAPTEVIVDLHGLPPGVHGFHIHERGFASAAELRAQGCAALGPHYNPTGAEHGSALLGGPRHAGDLINNLSVDVRGRAQCRFWDDQFGVEDIVGRSVVIHAQADDLGSQGRLRFVPRTLASAGKFALPVLASWEPYASAEKRQESLKTGNAAQRIACANIVN